MVQTFYGLTAISILALLTLNVNRAIHQNEQNMMMDEIYAQVTGVGVEILELVGSRAYDAATISNQVLTNRGVLVQTITGSSACNPNLPDTQTSCLLMNEYQGRTATRYRNGSRYTATISMRYVNELNPAQGSSTPTFAKEVTVAITCPDLKIGDDPLTVSMSRVFTYPRIGR